MVEILVKRTDRLTALKATLVATGLVGFFVCLIFWTIPTAIVLLAVVATFMVLVIWSVAYGSFKRNDGCAGSSTTIKETQKDRRTK